MGTHGLEKTFLLLPGEAGKILINESPALAGPHTRGDLFLRAEIALA
jgi:hypothetical protein